MPPVAKKAVPAKVSDADVTGEPPAPETEPSPDVAPDPEALGAPGVSTAETPAAGPAITEIEKPDPDLVNIAEPCPACYPQGWFEGATDGARASCPHLSVVFGEFLALERAQAIELGYEDRSAEK